MSALDRHLLDFFTKNPNQGAGSVPPRAGIQVSRQTLSRRLTALVDKGELIRIGRGSGSRYLRADLEAYFRIPATQRQSVSYIRERGSRDLPRFTGAQLDLLTKAAGEHGATAEETVRAVRERLLVEFSFASSNLEGNTYDLIQTETLIKYGQVAPGKTPQEAKMILNHRDAIGYLLDNITTLVIDWTTLRDLHALLSDGLLDEAADSGRVRGRMVAITHSAYTPLDNEYQIREALEVMLAAVNEEPEPFSRSLMLMTGVAYLQVFADCNKRTGRLISNLPLLKASLPPLSFMTVDKEAYTRGLLAYYELGNGQMLAKAYVDAYRSSAESYRTHAARVPKSSEQMAAEIRYQAFARARLKDIVLERVGRHAALPDSIPTEDKDLVTQMIRAQMQSLHPGHAAPLGVTSADIEAYLRKIG